VVGWLGSKGEQGVRLGYERREGKLSIDE